MDIKLDSDALATIASSAIFDAISEETRQQVLTDAVKYLLTPVEHRNSFGYVKKTPLQEAFEQALQQAAFKAVREYVESNEEIHNHIQSLLGPLMTALIDEQASRSDYGLTDAIGHAISVWLNTKANGN